MPVPVLEVRVRTAQPSAQLVQEQPRIFPAEELGEHLLRLALRALDVDRLEDGEDVLKEELGVGSTAAAEGPFGTGLGFHYIPRTGGSRRMSGVFWALG